MPNEPPERVEGDTLRASVEGFIHERLKPKLEEIEKKIEQESDAEKKQDLQEKRQKLLDDHQREVWLEDAARRASQIQLVTHTSKHMHPKAKGSSSLHAGELPSLVDEAIVGTHTLGAAYEDDVVGNAAVLDVYKFLKVEYQGQSLLTRVRARAPELISSFSDDLEKATAWVEQFAAITESVAPVASHTLVKQLYFPLQNGGYHLLAPLFPTSLVHTVYTHLREARFSDEVKQAREARKDGRAFEHGYSEYPTLAVQTFGGTKPQNVSQLNSERHGENWLLPSLPPNWQSAEVRLPLRVKTVFGRWFGNRPSVRELTQTLAKFLAATDYNNMNIRRKRAELVDYLRDELLHFSAELSELTPGWTTNEECRLDQAEILWLDPGRADTDEVFAAHYRQGNWKEEIASRFGNWLNGELRYHSKLPVGEVEHAEWMSVVQPVIDSIKGELAHD